MMNVFRLCLLALTLSLLYNATLQAIPLRDPTKPVDVKDTIKSGSLDLSAIIISSDKKLAVINGQIVHEGDVFNDLRVISIQTNTVTLEGAEGVFALDLLTYQVKKAK